MPSIKQIVGGAIVLFVYLGLGYSLFGWEGVKAWSVIAGGGVVVAYGVWLMVW